MLKILAYLNLVLAVMYFLIWLQQGSYDAITGIILIILFSIQTLKRTEKERYKWTILSYVTAIPVLAISGFLLYSGLNLMLSGIENGYQDPGLILLYVYSLIFALTLLLQLIGGTIQNIRHLNDKK